MRTRENTWGGQDGYRSKLSGRENTKVGKKWVWEELTRAKRSLFLMGDDLRWW